MNVDGPDLEDRYRRVLRLLPGYYRATWEEDMAAAFLDSRMTGDEDDDEYAFEFGRPAWPEVASVAALAARLYLGGAGAPRRYLAWGQAVRRAVLAVVLAHASQGLAGLTLLAWRRHQARLAPRTARDPGRPRARRLAHGGGRHWLRLDRGLRGAGPRASPDRPGHRGAGRRR